MPMQFVCDPESGMSCHHVSSIAMDSHQIREQPAFDLFKMTEGDIRDWNFYSEDSYRCGVAMRLPRVLSACHAGFLNRNWRMHSFGRPSFPCRLDQQLSSPVMPVALAGPDLCETRMFFRFVCEATIRLGQQPTTAPILESMLDATWNATTSCSQ